MTDTALADDFAEDTLTDDFAEAAPLTLSDKMRAAKEYALIPKPKLSELLDVTQIMRMEIEGGQVKLVAEGDRETPHPGMMRRAALLHYVGNMILIFEECRDEFAAIIKKKKLKL